ncbi:hypothetical protein I7I50_10205 [Histoplasma capsulatum G186AR]|uniref:Uncharacterized protein n=1 Tax=Ajellomyces capsulatus TaxID=5037 RepID=A0A8H7Z629_AJECA|nr:hypothetical protein I7I52_01444 [Histoplasma capsulatum]QSS69038.1 hypothetical protein I7I50_10205 [Histoplasma capsulatum G186AR]
MFGDCYCIGGRIWRFVSSAETGSLKRTGGSHGQPSEGNCTTFLIVQVSYAVHCLDRRVKFAQSWSDHWNLNP